MNEQLQTALTQIIDKTMAGVDQSVDFLSEQIPDVLSQLLLWYGVSNIIYALVGIVVLYACYHVVKKPKGTNETPHGECGTDKEEGFFRWDNKNWLVTYRPDWNRYDKQYYYIDNCGNNTTAVEIS